MKFKLNPLAQEILEVDENNGDISDIEDPSLVEYIESISTGEGFWYGLTNGYFKIEDIVIDKDQVNVLKEAIKLIEEFETLWGKISYDM